MSTSIDLSFLDDELKETACFTNEGREVMWPRTVVDRVIDSLADRGFVVFGLDLRSDGDGFTPPGLSTEIPISAFRPDTVESSANVEAARVEAHSALSRLDLAADFRDYGWVLVTWGRA